MSTSRLARFHTGFERHREWVMPSGDRPELREERGSFWSLAFTLLIGALACISAGIGFVASTGANIVVRPALVPIELVGPEISIAILTVAAIAACARWSLRRLPLRVVRAEAQGLLVPTLFRFGSKHVPYPEIQSLQLAPVWFLRRTFLAIGVRRHGPTILSHRRFGSPDQLSAFRDSLLARIGALSSGSEERARVERRSREDERPLGAPLLGLALVIVIGGLFWAFWDRDGLSLDAAYRWSLVRGLAANGELFRVVTANWLHADVSHLLANSVGLLLFAWPGERVLGSQRMLGIGMVSGILAFGVMTLVPGNSFDVGLGMSAWVFGWAGAWLWLRARHRAALPPLLQSRALVVGVLVLLLGQWTGNWSVDAAHGVGLATGVAASVVIARDWKRLRVEPVGVSAGKWIMGTSIAALCVALAWGVADCLEGGEEDARLVLRWMLAEADPASIGPSDLTESLNSAAWDAAEDPEASRQWLEEAERAANWALELSSDTQRARTTETLATVRYRLGDLDQAIELAWEAVDQAAEDERIPRLISQAARFELARARTLGALHVEAAPDAILERVPGRSALHVSADSVADVGLNIHAIALKDGTPLAHVRAYVPRTIDIRTPTELMLDDKAGAALTGFDEIVTTRTELTSNSSPDPGVLVQALDREVLDLP